MREDMFAPREQHSCPREQHPCMGEVFVEHKWNSKMKVTVSYLLEEGLSSTIAWRPAFPEIRKRMFLRIYMYSSGKHDIYQTTRVKISEAITGLFDQQHCNNTVNMIEQDW